MSGRAYAFMKAIEQAVEAPCSILSAPTGYAAGLGGVEGAASRSADDRTPPMTTDYSYSLSSLAQILSALDGERRNPNTKRNAIKAIERAASRLGLDSDDVFDAADGLLSGRLSAAAWLAHLGDEGSGPTSVAEAPNEPTEQATGDEPAEAYIMPNAGPLAVTPRRRSGSRPDSKQARMIAMLKRPEGVTVEQIAEEMGWARHYADARIMPR
jgi:hypothetical protein